MANVSSCCYITAVLPFLSFHAVFSGYVFLLFFKIPFHMKKKCAAGLVTQFTPLYSMQLVVLPKRGFPFPGDKVAQYLYIFPIFLTALYETCRILPVKCEGFMRLASAKFQQQQEFLKHFSPFLHLNQAKGISKNFCPNDLILQSKFPQKLKLKVWT